MKYLSISNILPLFALLALGCSSPTALQTSESDDVYFASTDRVVRVVEPAQVSPDRGAAQSEAAAPDHGTYTELGEELNPEYSDNMADGDTYVTDDYRDESYGETFASRNVRPRYHMPFNRFSAYSMAMMDPFSRMYHPYPYRSFIDPYGASAMMYDPFYAYDPFYTYDPFYAYDPFYMSPASMRFGFGFGSPWGFNRWGGLNNYYMGYNRGYQNGLYRQYYANNEAFSDQQRTHYAPRSNRSISPATRSINASRVGTEGVRSSTNVNNATDGRVESRGRYGRAADERNSNRRPRAAEGTDAQPARNERPALVDRPGRARDARTTENAARQQGEVRPGDYEFRQNTRSREQRQVITPSERPRRAVESRPQRVQPSQRQNAAPAREYRRIERNVAPRPARRESAPIRREINTDYNRSSGSFSQPSYSSPSSSPARSAPSGGGGRPSR